MQEQLYASRYTGWILSIIYLWVIFCAPLFPASITYYRSIHRENDQEREKRLPVAENADRQEESADARRQKKECSESFSCSFVNYRTVRLLDVGTYDPVAFFTLVLAISTIGLWSVTNQALRHAQEDARRQASDTRTSLRLAVKTANATKRAADAAIAAQRPWIDFVFSMESPVIFDKNGCSFSCSVKPKNIGNAPATQMIDSVFSLPGIRGEERFGEAFEQISVRVKASKARDPNGGHALFPKEERSHLTYKVNIPAKELEAAIARTKDGKIALNTSVSVDYNFAGGTGRTCRTYFIWTAGDMFGKWGLLDPSKGTYSKDDIVITGIPAGNLAT